MDYREIYGKIIKDSIEKATLYLNKKCKGTMYEYKGENIRLIWDMDKIKLKSKDGETMDLLGASLFFRNIACDCLIEFMDESDQAIKIAERLKQDLISRNEEITDYVAQRGGFD